MLEDLNGEFLRACRNAFARWLTGAEKEETLFLDRGDVSALMQDSDWLDAVAIGFKALTEGRAQVPIPMTAESQFGAFHAKAATLTLDRTWFALKLNGNFPANRADHGLPTIQGAILLCDAQNGRLLAIMDSIEVTTRRTAAATALAARYLARSEAETVLICGCGEQASAQFSALCAILPIRKAFCWDCDAERARTLALQYSRKGMTPVQHVTEAATMSDVIVTCTTATQPFLTSSMVKSGTFIAAVGADSPHKSEIAPELVAKALVVTDSTEQCAIMGDLHHAISAGLMTRAKVHAEIPELVVGTRPGRTDDDQITLFDSTGTAVQDVAAAVTIYQRAAAGSAVRAMAFR